MAYTYPGQAFTNRLTALKGWYEEGALDAECELSDNVDIGGVDSPAVSGLCVHITGFTTNQDPYGSPMTGPKTMVVEMGCGVAHGMPLWLWSGQNDPDISNPGVPAGVPIYGTTDYNADFISALPEAGGGRMPALVASGGYELETTEYDTDQTYTAGNGLRTVTSNTDANAGKLTNQRGATAPFGSAGATQFGDPTLSAWDTIVGFVSRGEYVNANRKGTLAFYPFLIPGTR